MHTNLDKLLSILKTQKESNKNYYYIPKLWNSFGYKAILSENEYEINVNPHDYYSYIIEQVILPQASKNINYSNPISICNKEQNNGDWITKQTLYSCMIRTSTAYDHNHTNGLELNVKQNELGTFIKTIGLLPLLKQMNVGVLYLLPISKYSKRDKKGDLGSPYGVSNFYELDPMLKDNITQNQMTIEEEFSALVEAAHILGIRIMIDIIPRTNAIENDLIKDHPDWFYWIHYSDLESYKPPRVDNMGQTISPTPELMEQVYQSDDVKRHISLFKENPKNIDENKWNKIVTHYKNNPEISFLNLVRKEFNMTIAPAFSDQINDPQPAWTDITFFRMYLDHPKQTVEYLEDKSTPPYILFDTIKNNFYQGTQPNLELWNSLSGIIPYFQKTFGIDGARIDMGHALSNDLISLIISKARNYDKNFAFIAEDLNYENDVVSKNKGYNMIIGNGFGMLSKLENDNIFKFIERSKQMVIPMFACGETHDTPRLSARPGGDNLNRLITVLNLFIPNTVPFINSGQELLEISPMNTGLDCRPNEQFLLNKNDPYYGKLALFDKYQFHYDNPNIFPFVQLISKASEIRKKYLDIISTNTSRLYKHDDGVIQIEFGVEQTSLFILVNPSMNVSSEKHYMFKHKKLNLLLSICENCDILLDNESLHTTMHPLELQIYEII